MAQLRRFLLLLVLAFSFGGFTFYASVVVPVGGEEFGKAAQGFVTRRVTQALNVSTVVSLAVLAWEIAAGWSIRGRWKNTLLACCTAVVGVCCAALFLLHPKIDAFLIRDGYAVSDYAQFYAAHRQYLYVSTAQWLATLPIFWIVANGAADSEYTDQDIVAHAKALRRKGSRKKAE